MNNKGVKSNSKIGTNNLENPSALGSQFNNLSSNSLMGDYDTLSPNSFTDSASLMGNFDSMNKVKGNRKITSQK